MATAVTDVLFGQSYHLRFDPKLWRLMQPYAPLGTLIAAAYVRSRGYQVGLHDAMLADSEAAWEAAVATKRPRVSVIYEDNFNYLSKMCLLRMRQAAFTMVAAAKRHGSTVVAAGSDASDHPERYLEAGADFVIVGEGDMTLCALVDRLCGRTEEPLEQMPGLAFRAGATAAVVRTPPRPLIRDLDALPFPAWDLVDIARYRATWQRHHGYFAMNMVTTRGCPYHCNWCAKPVWGQTYHSRTPANVAEELAWIKSTCGPDLIWFADDILALHPGWMARFAEEVEARAARVPFKCQSRVDLLLRDGEIEAFGRAGARTVWVGAESGSQQVLDAMDKGIRVEQIYEASRRLHAAGIRVGFFLQFGYPGEGQADIDATMRMVRECRPDEIGMSVSYPLPGTKFFQMVREELGAKQNWVDSDDLDMMFAGAYSPDFYRQLYRVLHKDFRVRSAARQLLGGRGAAPRLRPETLRLAGALLFHSVTLPRERWRLSRLAQLPGRAPGTVRSSLTPAQAAAPTPQSMP
jgi:radical SAM superfamily enzyme YgiQ (UPF0313 family)